MTTSPSLPLLAIVETNSPFDEALIMIDGREEETITIECPGARALAEAIIAACAIAHLVSAGRPPADEQQTPYDPGPGAEARP